MIAIEVPRVGRQHRPVYEGRDPFAGTYRRRFTGDYHCSREEVAAMLRDSSEKSLDLELSERSKLSDLDAETIHSYRTAYNINHSGGAWTTLPDDQFLCRIGAADELEDGTVVPTRAGSGVPNMVEQWASCGYSSPRLTEELDPELSTVFLPLDDSFVASAARSQEGSGFSKNEQCAVDLARDNGRVTTRELAEAAGISKQAASALLKRLADRGVLRWHGNSKRDPSQYYWLS